MLAWLKGRLYVREPDGTDTGITSLGLYLHLPFCDHKCAYCDFNSYAGLDHLIPAYVDALVRDIGLWAPLLAGHRIETIFFGGGTPSLTPAPLLGRILAAVAGAATIAAEGRGCRPGAGPRPRGGHV